MAKTDMKKGLAAVFGVPATAKEELAVKSDEQIPETASIPVTSEPRASITKKAAQEPKKTGKRASTAATAKKPVKKKLAPSKAKKIVTKAQTKPAKTVLETVAPTKEYKVAFNLQLPQSLHTRLSFYADNFAIGRKSSVTNIIITAIEQHLGELEKKAGI